MSDTDQIKPGDIICFKDEPSKQGQVTCLSDCGTCVYFKPFYGNPPFGFRSGVDISLLVRVKRKDN